MFNIYLGLITMFEFIIDDESMKDFQHFSIQKLIPSTCSAVNDKIIIEKDTELQPSSPTGAEISTEGMEKHCLATIRDEMSDNKQLPSVTSKNKIVTGTGGRRKHNCSFCDIPVQNFARHLERQHDGELQVQQFLSLKKTDPLRKQLISKLRKEGDFCSGDVIPVQGKGTNSNDTANKNSCKLLPCTYCKG